MKRRDWMKASAGAALALPRLGLSQIPGHPSLLHFDPIEFEPPDAAQYRRELPGGAIAYLVEDHQFPLVDISLSIRTGEYLVSDQDIDVAGFTGSQMRGGGTKTMSSNEFDEEAAFLATEIGCNVGGTSGSAGVGCLKANLDRSLEMFFDMLLHPAFDPERLELAVAQTLQSLARRNDSTGGIVRREFARLMRGQHFTTRQTTEDTVRRVTPERMAEFHAQNFAPSRFIFAVSGDFETDAMVDKLSEYMTSGEWPTLGPAPEIPAPAHQPRSGVYMVDKVDENLNQAQVRIGHSGIARSNPDHIAVSVMNYTLGGGSFVSRIMSRVRSDEGLAYSASSDFSPGTYYPGLFTAAFQSENGRCAQAATIVLEEMRKIREEKISAEELELSQNYNIEVFPRFFASAGQIAGTFASDEYTGREAGYWQNYRDRIADVTVDEVQRVAQKYLQPDHVVVLAVGATDAVKAGNPDEPDFSFQSLDDDGAIEMIPLPDPVTMIYPEA
ncbi:MAG: pitrilysin family protein [Acidobacteria bacterium]|nr:pitrilysin family protein [Acidobacteriota bacterium]MDA1233379.1 pitrilysin family protein [Acidobacteriota bacterium]